MFTFHYFKIPRTLSREYCTRVLHALEKVVKKPQQGIINLIVTSEKDIAWMNEQYRGKEGPTDILTFSYFKERQKTKDKRQSVGFFGTKNQKRKTKHSVVGEIYLCLEKIKIYAEEAGKTYKEQLEYIVIHGLVHLMGYDHESEEDTREMEKIEHQIQVQLSFLPDKGLRQPLKK